MSISKKRLDEIRMFEDEDISDLPELNDEELDGLVPCHLINKDLWKPKKKATTIQHDQDILLHLYESGKTNKSEQFSMKL